MRKTKHIVAMTLASLFAQVPATYAAHAQTAGARLPGVTSECLTPSRSFQMFDATNYASGTPLANAGLPRAHVVDRDFWENEGTRQRADARKTADVVRGLSSGGLLVLDVEGVDLNSSPAAARRALAHYKSVADAFRRADGTRPIGFYGMLPFGESEMGIGPIQSATIAKWRRDNDALRSLAGHVDVIFPSLYTASANRREWRQRAELTVCEARRLSGGAPVVPFIWPEYHDGSALKNQPIDPEFWRFQLETMAEIADGAVIWDGWDFRNNRLKRWQPSAPWWSQTVAFMRAQDRSR